MKLRRGVRISVWLRYDLVVMDHDEVVRKLTELGYEVARPSVRKEDGAPVTRPSSTPLNFHAGEWATHPRREPTIRTLRETESWRGLILHDRDPKFCASFRSVLAGGNAKKAGVEGMVRFDENDLFKADIDEATVVTLFLLPKVNLRLRPKLLRELKPGTRIVSNTFDMGDWKPDKEETLLRARTMISAVG